MRRLFALMPPVVLDGLLAVFFTVLAQAELRIQVDDGYQAGPLWLNTPLELLCTLPLALRSARPRLALLLMGAAMAGPALLVGHTLLFWGNVLPLMLVNYTVARTEAGWLGRWSWLACTGIGMVFALHMPELRTWGTPVFPLVMFGATSAAGRLVRRLSDQGAALRNALDRLAAEQAFREEAAVDAERRRMAAEMHDVVAHAVSLMTMQVGAARLELEAADVAVPPQLRAAEDTGRRAAGELRRALGVVRATDATGDLEPLPDLRTLSALVPRFAAAGVPVTVRICETRDLPASLQLAAYRIVQEALTNVVKHAGHVPVAVDVVEEPPGQLTVTVRNAPGCRSVAPTAGGHGLAGMRERVAIFGGSLQAGATSDGGFEVRASLPVLDAAEPAANPPVVPA
ncbi:MAG: sensor histidine kinase [Nocardioides sp.]